MIELIDKILTKLKNLNIKNRLTKLSNSPLDDALDNNQTSLIKYHNNWYVISKLFYRGIQTDSTENTNEIKLLINLRLLIVLCLQETNLKHDDLPSNLINYYGAMKYRRDRVGANSGLRILVTR